MADCFGTITETQHQAFRRPREGRSNVLVPAETRRPPTVTFRRKAACSDERGVGWTSRRPFGTWEILAHELGHALGGYDFLDGTRWASP